MGSPSPPTRFHGYAPLPLPGPFLDNLFSDSSLPDVAQSPISGKLQTGPLCPSLQHPFLAPNGWVLGEGERESSPGPKLVFALCHPSPSPRSPTWSGSRSASMASSSRGLRARSEGNSEQAHRYKGLAPQVGGETNPRVSITSRKNHVTVSSDPELWILPAVGRRVGGRGMARPPLSFSPSPYPYRRLLLMPYYVSLYLAIFDTKRVIIFCTLYLPLFLISAGAFKELLLSLLYH